MAEAIIGAVASSVGIGVHQGERQRKQEKRALRLQETAQRQAEGAALRQEAENRMSIAAANQREPDVTGMLLSEQEKRKRGAGATLLSSGVPTASLKLGKTTLLGE